MVGRLVVGLIWLTFVRSDTMENAPMGEEVERTSMGMSDVEPKRLSELLGVKSKRYLSHQNGSPCPPFYPSLPAYMRMYDMRPYGPPAYPKNEIHQVMYLPPKKLQYVHQPSYLAYMPKQTIRYVKPEYQAPIYQSPIYHAPVMSPPVQHYQQPIFQRKMYSEPVFSYAPAYQQPMPMIWPVRPVKKYDYPSPQVSYHQPTIVYKPDPPKCSACPASQPPPQHHQPSTTYFKVIQPPVQYMEPAKTYLPAPVDSAIVKPCSD